MPKVLTPPSSPIVEVPDWVADLDSFRSWRHSGILPDELPVHFISGRVWVDTEVEEVFSHTRVKQSLNFFLDGFVRRNKLGVYYPDGVLLTNDEAQLGVEPDAMFIARNQFENHRVEFRAGKKAAATEMVAAPDLVVEIVSPSSVKKDTVHLMRAYHQAKIPEYWLIDGRKEHVRFDIYQWSDGGYVVTESASGWKRSEVFSAEFRLVRVQEYGVMDYTLEIR